MRKFAKHGFIITRIAPDASVPLKMTTQAVLNLCDAESGVLVAFRFIRSVMGTFNSQMLNRPGLRFWEGWIPASKSAGLLTPTGLTIVWRTRLLLSLLVGVLSP